MTDPEYAAKWNALMSALSGVPIDIPDDVRTNGCAVQESSWEDD